MDLVENHPGHLSHHFRASVKHAAQNLKKRPAVRNCQVAMFLEIIDVHISYFWEALDEIEHSGDPIPSSV